MRFSIACITLTLSLTALAVPVVHPEGFCNIGPKGNTECVAASTRSLSTPSRALATPEYNCSGDLTNPACNRSAQQAQSKRTVAHPEHICVKDSAGNTVCPPTSNQGRSAGTPVKPIHPQAVCDKYAPDNSVCLKYKRSAPQTPDPQKKARCVKEVSGGTNCENTWK